MNKFHFAVYLVPPIFIVVVAVVCDFLFKMSPKHSADMLSSIPKYKITIRCLVGENTCGG